MRLFQERVNWVGKTHLKYGWYHPIGWCSRMNKKEKVSWVPAFISHCFLILDAMWLAVMPHALVSLPSQLWRTVSLNSETRYTLSSSCFCQGLDINNRNNPYRCWTSSQSSTYIGTVMWSIPLSLFICFIIFNDLGWIILASLRWNQPGHSVWSSWLLLNPVCKDFLEGFSSGHWPVVFFLFVCLSSSDSGVRVVLASQHGLGTVPSCILWGGGGELLLAPL